jgi:chromosome condensin MukBEF ATPase and DNA-binding subunit MukB
MSAATIESIAFCGWRGIDYLCFGTDRPLSAFLGENGAGKSTLAIALIYALLPDRKVLNVRPISDIKDNSVHLRDSLSGRIDPDQGYAYVALDISTLDGKRLVAGIYLLLHNQRLHIKPFSIPALSKDVTLFDVFNHPDGEQTYTPDFVELKRNLAKGGIDCYGHENLGEYGKLLHDAGILPTPMYSKSDRELFARLLETSFLGGVSAEIAKNLKHYLLQEAKHIPETVRRMQECTEDVLRTQRALAEAKRQIKLVQAAFISGRSLVSNAIAFVRVQFTLQWSRLDSIRVELLRARAAIRIATATIRSVEQQLEEIQKTEKQLREVCRVKRDQCEADLIEHREQNRLAEGRLNKAKERHDSAENGSRSWKLAAGNELTHLTYDELEAKLECALAQCQAERARKNEDVRRLMLELDGMRRDKGGAEIAALAEVLNSATLAKRLSHLTEREALQYEAALHGMTDGLVGVVPEDLRSVEPIEGLPSCFWIGAGLPEISSLATLGSWNVLPSLGGYTVLSDSYRASFGDEARAQKAEAIEEQIRKIETFIQDQLGPAEDDTKKRHRVLLKDAEHIQLFLAEKRSLEELAQKRADCEREVADILGTIKKVERAIRTERDDLERKLDEYAKQRELIRPQLSQAQGIVSNSTTRIASLQHERTNLVANLRHRLVEMRECRTFQAEQRFKPQQVAPTGLEEAAIYVGVQNKAYLALAKALEEESAERQQAIAALEIDHHAPLRCLTVWPALMDILKDHVPSTMLDLGEELLIQMETRRDSLLRELIKKQDNVKVHARIISTSIQTQIVAQKRQVNALSEVGRNLKFGKVEGIRITLIPKARMIELLQKIADDASLFSADTRSMEEVLSDYFREALDERLDGAEVLDYRTFVDLKLEAKRLAYNDWVPAFSLSGGEAIGAGIAVVLMLYKALAARGDHRPERLTPVFIMDEINRIDARGQRTVVELCETHGIQLFVTGPEMVPAKNTRMYMLARAMEPVEQVIVRELRGFAG